MHRHDSIDIDPVMRAFARFLRESVPIVRPLAAASDDPGYLDDWIQANWEAMVEAALPRALAIRLRVYGNGAACNAPGGRITERGVGETHHVVCRPRRGVCMRDAVSLQPMDVGEESTVFERFVAADDRGCSEVPPFDHVLVHLPTGPSAALALDGVRFELSRTLDAPHRQLWTLATSAGHALM